LNRTAAEFAVEHKQIIKVILGKRRWEENLPKLPRPAKAVLKVRIRFEGKARDGKKGESRCKRDELRYFAPSRNTAIGP